MTVIKDTFIKVSKVYSDQTLIRAGINVIPYVGGSIDILLSSAGQNFVIKRIEKFIEHLENQVSQLDASKINSDFLKTELGFDLIVKAFNSASKTRQDEKLKLYAKIIKESIILGKEYQEDEPETYLRIIEDLSVKELKVAKCLFDIKEKIVILTEEEQMKGNDAAILANKYPEFDKDELISILVRLERTGLIRELVGMYLGYMGGQYLINPLFKKFIKYMDGL
jgi:hypothetical protein